jgi:hypothetical protein
VNDSDERRAWVSLVPEEAIRDVFADHPYSFGFIPAMGRLISTHDAIGPYFGALFAQIMFAPGALSRQEREMIAGVAAAAQDCHY